MIFSADGVIPESAVVEAWTYDEEGKVNTYLWKTCPITDCNPDVGPNLESPEYICVHTYEYLPVVVIEDIYSGYIFVELQDSIGRRVLDIPLGEYAVLYDSDGYITGGEVLAEDICFEFTYSN